ncbi:MAG: hypothetical protein HOH04_06390, partial [Rhodospirillaceae bacterium]|nr:hypothetical protein [Rhodospirillaceae bacterium]
MASNNHDTNCREADISSLTSGVSDWAFPGAFLRVDVGFWVVVLFCVGFLAAAGFLVAVVLLAAGFLVMGFLAAAVFGFGAAFAFATAGFFADVL